MSLKDTVAIRLEIFIEELTGGRQIDFEGNPRLGRPPIGFDDDFLRGQFLFRLNGTEIGFADLLGDSVSPSEVSGSTKVLTLVDSIIAKSRFPTNREYKAKMDERVRMALLEGIADTAGIDPDQVRVFEPVSQHTGDLAGVQSRLNSQLKKYLLSEVRLSDLQRTVMRAQQRILKRTFV